ncbi:MAG: hypothetical protein WCL32_02660 [Planctomycetota bacterium]
MTLAKNLRQSLTDPNQGQNGPVTASAGPWSATAHTPHRDKVGAEIDELTVERAAPGPGSVKGWADKFAGAATGLLEPLKVQEVDAGKNEALIRSSPPSSNDAGADYYEVKLHGTQKASVKRYHAEGGKRESIPFTLTHDGVEKLVDGLTGSQK